MVPGTVAARKNALKFPALTRTEGDLNPVIHSSKTFRSKNSLQNGCLTVPGGIYTKIRNLDEESIPRSFFCRDWCQKILIQATFDSNYGSL